MQLVAGPTLLMPLGVTLDAEVAAHLQATMSRVTSINHAHTLGPDFLGLTNALSTLYPRSGLETRLLDAMSLAVRR